jgi:ParB family chromosome partitioning protein
MEKHKALGRGLQALIPEVNNSETGELTIKAQAGLTTLNISEIRPSRFQPRTAFKAEKLDELIASIREKGIVQPVLVRKAEQGYELIAGERRFRAVRALNLKKIPVIIRNVDDANAMELALVENIQREDLNPIEEAKAYKRLNSEFNFTQEQIAQAVGRDRTSVANILRLLSLPDVIQQLLLDDAITMGHARALLAIPDQRKQIKMCNKIVRKGLSVREVEQMVKPHAAKRRLSAHSSPDRHIKAVEDELQKILGTKIKIQHGKKRGKIVIDYYSLTDLNRIIKILKH